MYGGEEKRDAQKRYFYDIECRVRYARVRVYYDITRFPSNEDKKPALFMPWRVEVSLAHI